MVTFAEVKGLASTEQGLCVVAVTRPDGSVHASVVNAGALAHPRTGAESIAFVTYGSSAKLALARRNRRMSITFRRGWRWAGVEGPADVIERDSEDLDVAQVLRDVFVAAGGTHDDWDEYDRVMAAEERTAVFVTPERVIGVV